MSEVYDRASTIEPACEVDLSTGIPGVNAWSRSIVGALRSVQPRYPFVATVLSIVAESHHALIYLDLTACWEATAGLYLAEKLTPIPKNDRDPFPATVFKYFSLLHL